MQPDSAETCRYLSWNNCPMAVRSTIMFLLYGILKRSIRRCLNRVRGGAYLDSPNRENDLTCDMLVSMALDVASPELDPKDSRRTLYSEPCILATSSELYATHIKLSSAHLLRIKSSIISCTLHDTTSPYLIEPD